MKEDSPEDSFASESGWELAIKRLKSRFIMLKIDESNDQSVDLIILCPERV